MQYQNGYMALRWQRCMPSAMCYHLSLSTDKHGTPDEIRPLHTGNKVKPINKSNVNYARTNTDKKISIWGGGETEYIQKYPFIWFASNILWVTLKAENKRWKQIFGMCTLPLFLRQCCQFCPLFTSRNVLLSEGILPFNSLLDRMTWKLTKLPF